ncbi:MAG: hypothetical protein A2076_12675 [Geobacteraceae bacterium GWC2_53_11]|nr:MAG: hypothetical protein A2076_12675 [Geobacteraceae bacterium GWC2_53_11]
MRSWLSNGTLRHPLSVPVLLVAVIIAVYYPALLSGINPIDDPGIFATFSASPSLSSIMLPGSGYYFRPIIELTFYLDNRLWGMAPSAMHLENILLHCVNSLLVYFMARKILVEQDNKTLLIPLMAALLFALHPANVEAVAWIAGRTDPLLALFVLSSCYFWMKWLDKPRWHNMAASLLLFGAALLTKESALAYGAVAILLAISWPGSATGRQRFNSVVIMIVPCLILVILALLFRGGASGLSRFISGSDFQLLHGTREALIAFGFYVRKVIVPFPLTFAITAVHPMYGTLVAVLLPAMWWVYRRNRLSGVLFLSAALLIFPAILVAVKQIAWTPFAERYLYLTTAFLVLGLVGIFEDWQRKCPVVLKSAFVIVICGFALGSFQRTLLWNDLQAFFEDAVAKSPEFGSIYYSLGGVLMQKYQIDRAAEAFATADRLNLRISMRYPIKSGIMGTMIAKGDYLEARTYFFRIFKKKEDAPTDFLELLYQADSNRLAHSVKENNLLLARDLLVTLELLYMRNSDPFWLYRSGQILLIIGNPVGAVDFFRRSYSAAPSDAYYLTATQKYLKKLECTK